MDVNPDLIATVAIESHEAAGAGGLVLCALLAVAAMRRTRFRHG
ncbi:MAG TPA: hypothetical protein VM327_08625 [Candidatus Thermoplasmatota archaeon]|nr:hypothetical protein [Candidatus Thermoplasmatota archaeon]